MKNKFLSLLRAFWKPIIGSAIFFITILVGGSAISVCTNFGYTTVLEHYVGNLSKCKKNPITQRVDVGIKSKTKNSWTKYNYTFISSIASNSVYLSYNESVFTSQQLNESVSCNVYGVGNGSVATMPLGFKSIYGDYNNVYYDSSSGSSGVDIYHCFISQSFADTLVKNKQYSKLAGITLSNQFLNNELVIDGVCEDSCLCNDYSSSSKFVFANYLCFASYLEGEELDFKLANNFNSNRHIFKKIFDESSFPSLFKNSSYFKMTMENNEWLVEEIQLIYSGKMPNYSYLPILISVLFAAIGFLLSYFFDLDYKLISSITDGVVYFCILIFALFGLFWISISISGLFVIAGFHISNKLSFITAFEILSILLFIFGQVFGSKIKEKDISNKQINNRFYEVNI